jgi:hypothetical protein
MFDLVQFVSLKHCRRNSLMCRAVAIAVVCRPWSAPAPESQIGRMVVADQTLIGQNHQDLAADLFGHRCLRQEQVDVNAPGDQRRVKDNQVRWIETLRSAGDLELQFNTRFFTVTRS